MLWCHIGPNIDLWFLSFFLGMSLVPLRRRRGVALTGKFFVVMTRGGTFPTRICAQQPAIVTPRHFRSYRIRQVEAAFLTEQSFARLNFVALEHCSLCALWARSSFERRWLTLPAHRITNPTSTCHRFSSYSNNQHFLRSGHTIQSRPASCIRLSGFSSL